MEPIQLAIFVFCLIGAGISSWNIGKSAGIVATVEYLIAVGALQVDDDDIDE